jgi:hypothetical protein
MRHRRSRSSALADGPALLRHVIRAAELECPRGHADTLSDLTALALRKVPSRGIFDPGARGEHELFADIESVAQAHLELAQLRTAWRAALDGAALSMERRDEIESAALALQSVSDSAYFYTGLAFGLVFVCVYRAD